MQWRYNRAYFILAGVIALVLTPFMVCAAPLAQIAFVSERDGNREIYVMDADGENPRNLTNHPSSDRDPSWSPDGKYIAFVSKRDGNREIYVINADGENLQRLTNSPRNDIQPAWFDPAFSVDPAGKKFTRWGELKQVGR